MTKTDILSELDNFTGTTQYFKASYLYDLNLTEGVNYLRNKLNCYWLIDIIGSVQHLKKIQDEEFIIWRIVKNKNSAIVSAYRDSPFIKENLLYSQKILYTDFLLSDYEFYQINNVLLLKSEN
jgi:hypothetical protein